MFTATRMGAITGGVLKTTGLGTMGLNPAGEVVSYAERASATTGQATLQGALTKLSGGSFKDGFSNGPSVGIAAGLANELTDLSSQLSQQARRLVNFKIYRSIDDALGRSPTILVPKGPQ